MAETNIGQATISNMENTVTEFEVPSAYIDSAGGQIEREWVDSNFLKWLGYYKKIPELKAAINAIAKWAVGKGFTANDETTIELEHIDGYGEDTFNTILKSMIITKQIGGDAYAEIIRAEDGSLLNLKRINTASMKIITNNKGRITKYKQISLSGDNKGKVITELKPNEVLHFVKDRIDDEIHGTGIIEAVEDIILMRNEALTDYRKVLHRNVYPLKIWKLDTDEKTKIDEFITKIETTVKDKENIFLPKGTVEVEISSVAPNATLNPLPAIEYLSGFFFQAVGMPQIILGGSQEFTEATAKIAYLAFQQSVQDEQREVEAQIYAQLGKKINLTFPASLENELLSDTAKDKTKGATQANDTIAGRGK